MIIQSGGIHMSSNYENYENDKNYTGNSGEELNSRTSGNVSDNPTADSNIFSSSSRPSESTESSYEWNSPSQPAQGTAEYHYSYVNGNNASAAHNPNNYENAYSNTSPQDNTAHSSYSTQTSNYSNQSYGGANQSTYGGYSNSNPYQSYNTSNYHNYGTAQKPKKVKPKKPRKPASKGFVAAMLIISILLSGAVGFGGGYLANHIGSGSNGGVNINKVSADNTSADSSKALDGTTTAIVKKTADSVVEIETESVVTGGFAQQYVQQGAGSGVIISEDGYIITNNHVIDGAENITVTLRDGTTSYTAALIGTDEDNDIALIKVDATGLSPATFGDSNKLSVGDYVVAIGNPLGQLGGTVTDGIVSALARQVTVDGNNMTLLQHNAQISPGNSGGGLFNANGELIGIVNAKDSATEVEGIAVAIPINNVLDIIDDLKTYGYVTGKIDLGMEITDITSSDTAFYYGVNQTGCYVLSVTRGSNAEAAGFRTGDLITKVNGTEISSSADIETAL